MSKTITNLNTLKINYLTQAQYDAALENDEINENEIYFTPDPSPVIPTYTGTRGDGTSTSFKITHNLGTTNIIVSVTITDSNNNIYIAPMSGFQSGSMISYLVTINNANQITLTFSEAPITGGANISIISAIATLPTANGYLML